MPQTWNVSKEYGRLQWIQYEFRALILRFKKTFIILDALDECSSTEGTLRESLGFLFSLQRSANVNILATSRFSEETASLFANGGVILEIQATDDDVRAYIDHRAAYFPPFVAKKPGLLTYIRDEIAKSSRGMFLLAKLYVNLLQGEINEKRIRKVIERFQNGSGAYDDAYDETMKRIESQGQYAQEIAKTIFGWILFSTRELSIPEIQHALAIEIGNCEFDDTNITDVEQLVSICIGLVTIDESNSLKFVHYTTKEYFERKLELWFPDIHRVLSNTCLTYMSLDAFNQGPCTTEFGLNDRLTEYPFYKYSAQNWVHHYRKHPGDGSMTMEFLAAEGKVLATSQAIFGFSVDLSLVEEPRTLSPISKTRSQDPVINMKEPLTGAHLAAFFGLTSPPASMVDSDMIRVDIEDHAGRTPLSWAVAYGHEELCNMLLQRGANPDTMNHFGFTPLFYAAVSGRVGIMQSLIQAGAQVDTVDQNGRTPLFHAVAGDSPHLMSLAVEGDCLASVKLLLNHGASATPVDNFGQTPLFAAASKGRESVVKLLIEKNAHLYYATSSHSGALDPLAYAAMNGYATTAKMLFDAGAHSVSAHRGDDAPSYVTLANLLKARSEGRDDIFRNLKDEGADLNIRDSRHRLPLHWAALNGDDNLVKCLLANGADVNAREAFGRTPLFYAIFGRRLSPTLLLLDHLGIDFQGTDIFGDTPLIQSYKRQDQENQWKLHNLLKIKSGDYEGLFLFNTSFLSTIQTPLAAICDACCQPAICSFSCTNCTSTMPPGPYAKSRMVKYCEYCISEKGPHPCPLCGHTLEEHGLSKMRSSKLDWQMRPSQKNQ
ncbi:hypothetical protein ASPWEDRAFT_384790 [Aspergillus wentii DTO 134E9]|uniref:Uncharacterized protein n=1 Tax=Aspergillus wentii DTO 134E9 TaxID=1073089 RepID=A0A1L9RXE5_ASPWE|nr:uncharacterized protein ASPWEDRAFT_384790 [Aspergillus wentii DTO 134E9]OJJ39599.1 hypothetical protein ASPWEDRAFT_384790 [Aspergillus wentii DTO 134E9]